VQLEAAAAPASSAADDRAVGAGPFKVGPRVSAGVLLLIRGQPHFAAVANGKDRAMHSTGRLLFEQVGVSSLWV